MPNQTNPQVRPWQVLLLGGPSGTGKTAVSYRLARHFGVGITEVDDFQVLLMRMTTPEQQPELHWWRWWRTHPAFDRLLARSSVKSARYGLPVVSARPWDTVLERVIVVISEPAPTPK